MCIRDRINEVKPDKIVNLVALTDVDMCEKNKELADRVNTGILRNILDVTGGGIPVLQVSTDSVFDGEHGNYKEEDKPHPLNYYAESKLRAEEVLLKSDGEHIVLRINIYGWDFSSRVTLLEWVLLNLLNRDEIRMFTDIYFNPVPAYFIAEVIFSLVKKGGRGIFHLGCDDKISKFEFGRCISEIFKLTPGLINPVTVSSGNLSAARPKNPSLNNDKLKRYLNIEIPGIETGLKAVKKELPGFNGYFDKSKEIFKKLSEEKDGQV